MRNNVFLGLLIVIQACGAGIVAADPTTLGLPAVAAAWIGIAMLGLTVGVSFLERWGGGLPGRDSRGRFKARG